MRRCLAAAMAATIAASWSPGGVRTAGVSPAGAQRLAPGETVRDRPHPWRERHGIRLSGFTLHPSLTATTTVDDNIRARGTGGETDVVMEVRPALALRSRWPRHGVRARLAAQARRHAANPDQDRWRARLRLAGHLDPTPASRLDASARAVRRREPPGDPDSRAGATPARITELTASLSGDVRVNALRLRTGLTLGRKDVADARAAGGSVIDNDDRDRRSARGHARIGWDIAPGLTSYSKVIVARTVFPNDGAAGGLDRDATGMAVIGGTDFALTDRTFGTAFSGVRRQRFDAPGLGGKQGVVSGLSLTSTITPLITVKLQGDRTLELTTAGGAAALRATAARVSYDHELLRRLMVRANASHTQADYIGLGRRDHITGARLALTYGLNSRVHLKAHYRHDRRTSTNGATFARNRVGVGVELRY